MKWLQRHNKCLISLALLALTVVWAPQSFAGNTRVSIKVVNCIPGKTLYPRIYSSHMSGQSGGNNVIAGPSADAKPGTCGSSAQLTHNYSDGGGIGNGLSGIIVITGLNGGSLIYNENQNYDLSAAYPDQKTGLPAKSKGFWLVHGAALTFISNNNYKGLPSGVSCPGGSSQIGPTCMGLSYNYDVGSMTPTLSYTVYVYPPGGNAAQNDQLPTLPSTNQ